MTDAVLGRNIFGRRAPWLAVGLLFGWALANGPAAAQGLPSPGDWEYLEWREWRTQRIMPAAAARPTKDDEATTTAAAANVARELEEAHKATEQTRAVPDDEWEAVLARVAGAPLVPANLKKLTMRAVDDGDPAAYEILGYVYASGWGAAIDYGRAYEYYGRAC